MHVNHIAGNADVLYVRIYCFVFRIYRKDIWSALLPYSRQSCLWLVFWNYIFNRNHSYNRRIWWILTKNDSREELYHDFDILGIVLYVNISSCCFVFILNFLITTNCLQTNSNKQDSRKSHSKEFQILYGKKKDAFDVS